MLVLQGIKEEKEAMYQLKHWYIACLGIAVTEKQKMSVPCLDIGLSTVGATLASGKVDKAQLSYRSLGSPVLQHNLHNGMRPGRVCIRTSASYKG